MDALIEQYGPYVFPVIFVAFWLGITTLLGLTSGWYSLMRRYPDRQEASLLQLKRQSGMMGMVNMGGILNLAVCSSGLRVGIMRIFGPWNRDFFVPWNDIRVSRRDWLFWKIAESGLANRRSVSFAYSVTPQIDWRDQHSGDGLKTDRSRRKQTGRFLPVS